MNCQPGLPRSTSSGAEYEVVREGQSWVRRALVLAHLGEECNNVIIGEAGDTDQLGSSRHQSLLWVPGAPSSPGHQHGVISCEW